MQNDHLCAGDLEEPHKSQRPETPCRVDVNPCQKADMSPLEDRRVCAGSLKELEMSIQWPWQRLGHLWRSKRKAFFFPLLFHPGYRPHPGWVLPTQFTAFHASHSLTCPKLCSINLDMYWSTQVDGTIDITGTHQIDSQWSWHRLNCALLPIHRLES